MTGQGFTRAEARQLPGALGDPLRAIEALPGVTPTLSGVPYFLVRGAPLGDLAISSTASAYRRCSPHWVGRLSSIPGSIQSVELYPGPYPVEYGRLAGGAVVARSSEPSSVRRGEVAVRATDSAALLDTALGDSTNLTLSGRYSYANPVLHLFANNLNGQYWDYQARLAHQLSDRGMVTPMGNSARGKRNGIAMLLTATTIASVAPRSRAQSSTDTDYEGPRHNHVTVSASPRTSMMRITKVGSHEPIAECANQCDFQALPGRYVLDAQERETGEHHRIGFRVQHPTSLVFEEGNPMARTVGASLGTIGSLSVLVGLGLLFGNASLGDDASPQTPGQHRASEVGLGLLLGGLLATPTGWIIFGQSVARLTQSYDPNRAGRGLRLGLVGVHGGLGVGGRVLF